MTDIKVVVPSDINTTAGGLKFEGRKWGVDIDNETIKLRGNTLYAVDQGGVEFANPDEIDAGSNAPRDKAISAYEYQKDVRCKNKNTNLGASAGKDNTGEAQTAVGHYTGERNTGNYQAVFGSNAGRFNTGNYQTALGASAGGNSNTGDYQTALGYYAGYSNTGNYQTAVGTAAGKDNTGINQTALGANAGYGNTGENSVFIGRYALIPLNDKTRGQTNINIIGAFSPVRNQESNYFQLGNTDTQNIYTSATYNGKDFLKTSDMRSKKVIQRLSTLDNGINVYLFQYLDNGMTSVGWMAQEVEELLREKGYDEQIIEIAIPRSHDVDWQATIGKFQNEIGSVVKSWTDAQALYNRLVAQYLTENGITESYEEFMQNMEEYFEDKEKNPPAEVTPENAKREEIYANLKAKDLNNYLTYADDIRRINESVVNNLL